MVYYFKVILCGGTYMSVHKAISQHSQKQHQALKKFMELDAKREFYIEQAINKCKKNESFSVELINQVTKEINEMAVHEIVPTRKYVTEDMIKAYVNK